MIKYILTMTLITFWTNLGFGQNIARVENITIYSKALKQEREILVYTPIEYDIRKHELFNVIFVFDSQDREKFDYVSSIITFLTDRNNDQAFIVVGITSPYSEELDYSRNNDFLPVLKAEKSIERYKPYFGNIPNFLNYVSSEVVPYINSNYRTKGRNIAVGHSLGASFILYSMTEEPNLFDSYIAISPNLSYDNDYLADKLIGFDYSEVQNFTYVYLSNANEGINFWQEWKPAREKVYALFSDDFKQYKIDVKIEEYPDENHMSTFPIGVKNAFDYYFNNIYERQENVLSEKEYKVTIKVKVPDKNDEIFITGNQENLANWNPNKIKLNKISDFERAITLNLKSIAEFKFTRGSWETEAELKTAFGAVKIKPENQNNYEIEIESYYDRY
ncbi:MAG: esterase [Candidatus Delongbacteria bacterium]|nr:esterase [Candidatus Delongbacteria bacterium]